MVNTFNPHCIKFAFGEKLSAGDVIITGSIVPPPMIEPDETEFVHAIDPIGEVSVSFARD